MHARTHARTHAHSSHTHHPQVRCSTGARHEQLLQQQQQQRSSRGSRGRASWTCRTTCWAKSCCAVSLAQPGRRSTDAAGVCYPACDLPCPSGMRLQVWEALLPCLQPPLSSWHSGPLLLGVQVSTVALSRPLRPSQLHALSCHDPRLARRAPCTLRTAHRAAPRLAHAASGPGLRTPQLHSSGRRPTPHAQRPACQETLAPRARAAGACTSLRPSTRCSPACGSGTSR